ncbi:MAG: hypothetical protein M9921_06295 [Fimbriimonadaceae bacterium]|nr:6-bladed beta-propeller [Chthonomonadaceae bacterium]MCO5296451.1 hypothetical protein [Fimbriimonadaceae bacterium]
MAHTPFWTRAGLAGCALALAALALAHPEHGAPPDHDGLGVDVQVRTGNGANTFETVPGWGKMPDAKPLGPTHGGIALDKEGRIYLSTDSDRAICVFEPDGTFLRSIALDCKGVHSLSIREEGGREYLYGAHLAGNRIVKLDLDGKVVLQIPNESTGEVPGGWNGLTAVTVAPDGSIFAAMGYGSNLMHKFDAGGKLLKTFGGPGKGEGQFQTCHGLAIDSRFGEPRLLVCDRENRRLVHMDLDGHFLGVYATFLRRPCAVSIQGDLAAVAELEGRVTIVDKNGTPVAFLGDNPDAKQWANYGVPTDAWKEGLFTAPHGLSYDANGNLYVQDWNATGRVTKLKKLVAEQSQPSLASMLSFGLSVPLAVLVLVSRRRR